MKRAHPLLSPFGIGFTLILFLSLGMAYRHRGGLLFAPGELSAQSRSGLLLQGFISHADFEAECQRCHVPLRSIQGELCLDCHADIAAEIASQNKLHGRIQNVMQCFNCHSDHQGRDFNLTQAALDYFDHNLARFSLKWHQVDYAANSMDCQDCHTLETDFATPVENCLYCHSNYDPDFMAAHQRSFGPACLDCHDGLDSMAEFDHAQTSFFLDGKHLGLACAECHQDGQFAGTPIDCASCHAEPQIHAGLFSEDCGGCHTPESWNAAFWNGQLFEHFTQSGFSLERHLTNFDNQPMNCQSCHLADSDHTVRFAAQECARCHQQADPLFMAEHQQQFGADCLACHDGTGRLANFDHNQFFPLDGAHATLDCENCHQNQVYRGTPSDCASCHAEPQIHAGLFGLQCQNCHSTQAWIPASLTSHTFPLDHGEQGLVACETCHPASYVAYTCYGCHEHQQAEIEREHLEEGISRSELPDCARCHPNGLEND